VIAATNRDLDKDVAAGRFRADLYFRLNVLPIQMPALREREGDIALLAHFFADRFARELGRRMERIDPDALRRLRAYPWPGNVRELSNVIERAVVLARGPVLEVGPELVPEGSPAGSAPVPLAPAPRRGPGETLEELERRHIQETLERANWVVEGARGAAAVLGMNASTLRSRMKKLGVRRPGPA
jgi:transcriptional regulator with GAF, ATPase, and Fis domain